MYFVDYENDALRRSAPSQRLTKKQGDDTALETSEQTRNRFRKDVRAKVLADIISVDLSVEDLKTDEFTEEGKKNQKRFFSTGSKELTTTKAYQKDEIVHSAIVAGMGLTSRKILNSGRSSGPVDATPGLTIQKGPNEEVLEVPLKSGLFDDINIRKGPEESSAVSQIPWKMTTQGFAEAKDLTEFVIQKGPPDTITTYKETPGIKNVVVNSLAIQKGPFASQVTAFTEHSDVTRSPTSLDTSKGAEFPVVTITEPRTQTSKHATDHPSELTKINTGDASQQGIYHRRNIKLFLFLSYSLSPPLSLFLSYTPVVKTHTQRRVNRFEYFSVKCKFRVFFKIVMYCEMYCQ